MARHLSDVKRELQKENPHLRGRIVYSRGPIIRNMVIGYCILALGVTGAFWWTYHTGKNSDRHVAVQALENCRDVERIKGRIRANAIKSYNELEENAQLLGIELTHDLRAKALRDRNITLHRFARESCPRKLP